jgi:hypothetical protein
MTTLLFGALWVNLAQCVLLTGAFSLLLLAGPPASDKRPNLFGFIPPSVIANGASLLRVFSMP